jgi:hypothetical protein
VIVKLSEDDRVAARACAEVMIANARRIRARDRFGEDSPESHYIGALGEIGFARYLGVPWQCHPADTGGRPDVAGYEVRTVSPKARLWWKTKSNDALDRKVAMVAIAAGRDLDDMIVPEAAVLIYGWLTSQEMREQGRWMDPGRKNAPAWFVDDVRRFHSFHAPALTAAAPRPSASSAPGESEPGHQQGRIEW